MKDEREILPYSELLRRKSGNSTNCSYAELLSTTEWLDKRKQIISRDNSSCQMCRKEETIVLDWHPLRKNKHYWMDVEEVEDAIRIPHTDEFVKTSRMKSVFVEADRPYFMPVHHKYYLMDSLPWEYCDDALVTLCQYCHRHVHETQQIVTYPSARERELFTTLTPCSRCSGTGTMPEYMHVQHGVCFGCGGSRFEEFKRFRFS